MRTSLSFTANSNSKSRKNFSCPLLLIIYTTVIIVVFFTVGALTSNVTALKTTSLPVESIKHV